MTKQIVVFVAGMLVSLSALAAGGGNLQQAGNDLGDQSSLQRGAALYMNYCSGCHSLKYVRYSRIASDLGLTEDQELLSHGWSPGPAPAWSCRAWSRAAW